MLKYKSKERGFYFYKIEVEGLICRESEPRESSFTAILHRFAQLDLRLLQRPVGELFVEVARVFVPVQCRNKWRSDSSLKSLTEQYNLQNFPHLLHGLPISSEEEVVTFDTVCTLTSQTFLWLLTLLLSLKIFSLPSSKTLAQPPDNLWTTPEVEDQ